MEKKTRKHIPLKRNRNKDLPETADDKKHLQPDEGTLDLPDAKEIPGQEHIRPILGGELADNTISSSDEEGENVFDEEKIITQKDNNVSKEEKEALRRSSESMATKDDEKLRQSTVDNKDEEGELLNERTGLSGRDLDVPGSEQDDANEEIGEEDEENNPYSQPGEKEDENTGRHEV